jgi:RNA recognition motif-containing protein
MTMIYVGNLSDDTDNAQTRALFERFGTITSMRITPGDSKHRFDGCGLIEMEEFAARKAIAELDGLVVDGAILSVREATGSQLGDSALVPVSATVDEDPPQAIMHRRYNVTEVEKVDGPGGADGDDWYRFVFERGASRITCFHRGTLLEVTEYVAECTAAFNERVLRGKYTHPLALRRKK